MTDRRSQWHREEAAGCRGQAATEFTHASRRREPSLKPVGRVQSRNATLELAALADFMNRYSSVKEYTVLSSTPFTSQAGPGSCRRLKLTSPPAAVTTLRPVQRYPAHEFMSPGLSEEEDEGSLPLSQPAASSHRHPRPAGSHSFGSAAKRARHTGGEADDLVHVPSFISPPGMLLKSQPRHDSRASAKAAPAIRQLRIAAPRGLFPQC